ncbi:25866_t:CDS:1, partial [Dentiscutata erythropus]
NSIHDSVSLPAFEWTDKSEMGHKEEYMEWLRKYVPLGNHLIWHDVGGNHGLLNISGDHRLPFNIRGGTDVVVVGENDVSNNLIQENIYAILEIKKYVERKNVMQTILELIAADLTTIDTRIVFGILSDLRDDWRIFWCGSDRKIKFWKAQNRAIAVQTLIKLLGNTGTNLESAIPAAERVKIDTFFDNVD